MADPIDTGKKTVTGRTIWRDPETGEDYSERSTTFEIDGKYYTMPTVAEDGTQYTEDQIREYVKKYGPSDYITGEELPEFRNREDAIEYAISRSDTRKQEEEPMLEEQMELFNEGGLKDEGGSVDPVSGNDVPIGSTKKEVRDDIPAMLSEGEFVFPADVTRFIGLEKLMQQRQEAKMGLKTMEAMGQMGNSEEATMPDDLPFGPADLVILGRPEEAEPKEMYGGGMVYANQGTFATGISGTQPSIYQGQTLPAAPAVPPSSVAPPTPTPAPAGGFIPTFIGQPTPDFTPSTPTTPVPTAPAIPATPSGTDDKFFETVGDVTKNVEYINPETGERRFFMHYDGAPVDPNSIPDGFIPVTDYEEAEDAATDDLESTSVESTMVRDDNDADKKALTQMVADQERKDADKFKKKLADAIESGNQENLMELYVQTQRDKKIMTGLALTGIGTLPALFGRFALSSREKELDKALTDKFGEGWEDSEAFKSISEASILDKAKSALSDAFDSAFTKEGRDAYYENYKAKYGTESHPLSRGVKSSLTPREQQAFDNAVSSGNSNVANHYAIINQSRAKLKNAVESGMTKEQMRGIGLSSFDIERGERLYKKKVKVTDPSSKVSSPLAGLTTTDDNRSAQETLNEETYSSPLAGLMATEDSRSAQETLNEEAEAKAARDKRRKYQKAQREKTIKKIKDAGPKGTSVSASQRSTPSGSGTAFAKGGLANKTK